MFARVYANGDEVKSEDIEVQGGSEGTVVLFLAVDMCNCIRVIGAMGGGGGCDPIDPILNAGDVLVVVVSGVELS